MALEGSLKDFGLADILQLIYFQKKTGILDLNSRMDRVKLQFIDGNIVGAESKRRFEDNRLGKILVKKGLIKDEELRTVLEEQRKGGAKLGTLLVEKRLVDKDKISEILNTQVTETVVQLFSWRQGTYEFSSQGVPQDKEFPFAIDTQHLLMEGLRIVDELSVIKDRITLDSVLIRKVDEVSDITPEEMEVLDCIDGENDVSTIIDLTGLDSFEVSKTVVGLMEKGLVDTKEPVKVAQSVVIAESPRLPSAFRYLPYMAVVLALVISFSMVVVRQNNGLKSYMAARKIAELRAGIEAHRIENSVYPASISNETDPWGRQYMYSVVGNHYLLKSAGPDCVEGTADDIF